MNKFIYYLLQWTWGLPMNLVGFGALVIAHLKKWKITKYYNAIRIVYPSSFGGMNMGMFFFQGVNCESVCPHEYGHSFQNTQWGFLFPFVIGIPSAIRYWIRRNQQKQGKHLKPYDAIWFEGQATKIGIAQTQKNNKYAWLYIENK